MAIFVHLNPEKTIVVNYMLTSNRYHNILHTFGSISESWACKTRRFEIVNFPLCDEGSEKYRTPESINNKFYCRINKPIQAYGLLQGRPL